MEWRVIRDKAYPAPRGLALDEALLKSVEERKSPNVLRFYFFSRPSVVIGHSQDISDINLEFIERRNMSFTRRMTGGGAIIMGCPEWHSQVGITLIISDDGTYPSKISQKFELLNKGVLLGLKSLNINADYCHETTDITVKGKKIAGSGIHSTYSTFLFHSTILVDYDIHTMLRVINFPEEKINDALLKKMENGYTTIRKELGQKCVGPLYVENTIENNIIQAYAQCLNTKFTQSNYTEDEIIMADKLEAEKYGNKEWVHLKGAQGMGACFLK
ncbi:MAG: biotin/lipoate A/B protein ligase family protein [Candidatus Freyarchaeota archaeon]